ncbi:MAG TPA: hypothetical protein VNC42_12260 [Bradyrhizobium sp.]|nr:hypothetical protein [Bradyrhizobium sp.]
MFRRHRIPARAQSLTEKAASIFNADSFSVMAGLRPGHPRLFLTKWCQDVDARHKAGHDEFHNKAAISLAAL